MPYVKLASFTQPQKADELCLVLKSVGIHAITEAENAKGNGIKTGWVVLILESDLLRAQKILSEELNNKTDDKTKVTKAPRLSSISWLVGLIIINIIVWAITQNSGGSENRDVLLRFGASYAPQIQNGQWWRTVTAVFLHIGARHLLSNTATLAILGAFSLKTFGAARFYFIYLLSGVGGNWGSFLLSPSSSIKAGASGAILGLLGALAGARIKGIQTYGTSRFKTWHVIAMLVAFYGFVVGTGPADHLAHLGGLLIGVVLGWALLPSENWPRKQEIAFENCLLGATAAVLIISVVFAIHS